MRTYVADLVGGTATATVQMQAKQTLKSATFSFLNAAAGKIELSTVSVSQIGTAQPTQEVVCRLSCGASGQSQITVPINLPVSAFQNVYVHQTGAGNLGSVTLQ
jgi:hypothetical protein